MKRLLFVAGLAVLGVTGLSCRDSTGANPGMLSVRLTTPNPGLDSAIVLTITGPQPITSATAGTGLRMFSQPFGQTATKIALTGQLNANAVILTIGVVDVGAVSQYSGTIQGVAQPTFQLRVLTGYALAVTR